jgi:hypothetical protein
MDQNRSRRRIRRLSESASSSNRLPLEAASLVRSSSLSQEDPAAESSQSSPSVTSLPLGAETTRRRISTGARGSRTINKNESSTSATAVREKEEERKSDFMTNLLASKCPK